MSNPAPISPPPNPVLLSAPSSTPSDSFWNRISNWASENKAVVYTIAGVTLIVTGAGVYYYLSTDKSSKPAQTSSSKKRSKNKKKAKKDDDTASKAESSKFEAPSASVTSGDLPVDVEELTDEYIASLSEHVCWSFHCTEMT
jgi:mitochondrial import receptor subunit TOM70